MTPLLQSVLSILGWQRSIPAGEREAILAYLAEEFKLAAFQDLEAARYNNVAAKYGGAVAQGTPGFAQMLSAAQRLSSAAAELVRRHYNIGPVPDEASVAYFGWQGTYMAYEEWASAVVSAYEAYDAGARPHVERLQVLLAQEEKACQRVQNEEGKFFILELFL